MTKELFVQAIIKMVLGIVLFVALIFIPAGSLDFWNGWLLMGILFIPMFVAGIIMMFKNPELLKKRLNNKETEKDQKLVIAFSALMFIAAFVFAGLNYRFNWIIIPTWLVFLGTVIFLLAYLMYAEVLRENEYLSRVVEVQENQKVVDTGLYGLVRHPMYSATLFLFSSMGLILGSPISFVILLLYIPIIVKRIKNEEIVLAKGLDGYEEYMKKVKYRIVPFIW